ncbi:MAG: Holliday junction resolvase RuvX [Spirochaetaceae bacterium]|nr:MAG: Holliday junction resolvase RuvX [Spirochaetaceae bacterium]
MSRILSVDLGTKRVGLAMTDPLRMIASPYKTLHYRSDRQLIADVLAIVEANAVETVVIGLPLHENSSESEGSLRSRTFAAKLNRRGVDTVLWDERYTSRDAEESLRRCGLDRRRALAKIDSIAASHILEDYLSEIRKR